MPATQRRAPRAPAPAAAPVIDLLAPWADPRKPGEAPQTHLAWAEHIARLIARQRGLGPRSAGADDLVAVAHVTLIRLAPRFDPARVPAGGDPDGQFRGWAHRWVKKECEREAERLTNAGLYHTTDNPGAKKLARRTSELPVQGRCPNCRDVAGWFADEPDEEPEPIATRAEPTLLILRDGKPVSLNGKPVADPGAGVVAECVR